MLPQEIKDRIYHFVCGGHMVHILQTNDDHHHAHGNESVELSHAICIEDISEQQLQQDFDSADPNTEDSNIEEIEHRHRMCHEPPSVAEKGHKSNQLTLAHLRSCRQIYFEANKVHYTDNTFAIFCNDILERFVKARFRNKQHLDIRSLYLDISIIHASNINTWSESISKAVLRRLKSVRCLHLNLVQLYCMCTVESSGYEGSEMTERYVKMFNQLSKLPLREATLIIDNNDYRRMLDFDATTLQYCWTMKQKQDFSKKIRDVLLG